MGRHSPGGCGKGSPVSKPREVWTGAGDQGWGQRGPSRSGPPHPPGYTDTSCRAQTAPRARRGGGMGVPVPSPLRMEGQKGPCFRLHKVSGGVPVRISWRLEGGKWGGTPEGWGDRGVPVCSYSKLKGVPCPQLLKDKGSGCPCLQLLEDGGSKGPCPQLLKDGGRGWSLSPVSRG